MLRDIYSLKNKITQKKLSNAALKAFTLKKKNQNFPLKPKVEIILHTKNMFWSQRSYF